MSISSSSAASLLGLGVLVLASLLLLGGQKCLRVLSVRGGASLRVVLTGLWKRQAINPSARSRADVLSIWPLAHPSLSNIEIGVIPHSVFRAVLKLDDCFLAGRPLYLAQSHAALNDGPISSVKQVVMNYHSVLLLAEIHLDQRLLQTLPHNLPCQWCQFFV